MIDEKTRKKILRLWSEGESKTSIQEKTGVSQPTIRRIIKEVRRDTKHRDKVPGYGFEALLRRLERLEKKLEGLTELSSPISQHTGDRRDRVIRPVDTFIVNLTRNWPARTNTPLQCLRNGIPKWVLRSTLKKVFSQWTANMIADEIEFLGADNIYEVQVTHRYDGSPNDVRVFPLE